MKKSRLAREFHFKTNEEKSKEKPRKKTSPYASPTSPTSPSSSNPVVPCQTRKLQKEKPPWETSGKCVVWNANIWAKADAAFLRNRKAADGSFAVSTSKDATTPWSLVSDVPNVVQMEPGIFVHLKGAHGKYLKCSSKEGAKPTWSTKQGEDTKWRLDYTAETLANNTDVSLRPMCNVNAGLHWNSDSVKSHHGAFSWGAHTLQKLMWNFQDLKKKAPSQWQSC